MADPIPNRSATPRGFTTYDQFTDSYGATVTIRQSSAADEPKVWIFAEGGAVENPSPHLTVEQAIRARDALDAFIKESGDE